MAGTRRASFEEFVGARGQAMQRFGYLLTSDWALAEDLVQTAFARAYPRWAGIERDDPEAYVRKVMVNTWSSWWRRRWHGEIPTSQLPEGATGDEYQNVDAKQAILRALAGLPPRQRLVLVLRYHQDLSERQVADLLGVSVGTVKSQAAKALARLRSDEALDGYRMPATGGA